MKLAFLFTAILLFCPLAFAQSEALGGIDEVYLARDDGEGKAGDQVTDFVTTDIPIHCVVLLSSDSKAVVKMNFVAVKVSGVKAETKVVTASYTTKDGQNRVSFTGRPHDKWTPGRYRVDLFLDGKPVRNLEFEIKGSGGNAANSAAKAFDEPAPAKRR